ANPRVCDRARIVDSRTNSRFRLFAPLSINRKKAFWFAQNLGRLHRDRGKLVVRKITAPGAKIGPRVAQDVNQLQAHAVALSLLEHLGFGLRGKFCEMAETKPGPKFPRTTSDEISVFIQLGRRFQSNKLFRIPEPLEIEELAAINLLKHRPDFF